MPARKTSPQAWIDAALGALAEGGPDAIRVEALATSLGVTKGGFYSEFADRSQLLERLLDTWEQTVVDVVVAQIDDVDDPRAKLRQLFDLAGDLTSDNRAISVELAIREWARRCPNVAQRLRRVDTRRMAYLRSLFGQISRDDDDAEARSLLAYSLFVASLLITVDHDGRTRIAVVDTALNMLLESRGSPVDAAPSSTHPSTTRRSSDSLDA